MADDFDTKIQQLESRLIEEQSAMARSRDAFASEAVGWLSDWFLKKTEELGREKPDASVALGKNGIAELKARVKVLQSRAPQLINDFVRPHALWQQADSKAEGWPLEHVSGAVRKTMAHAMGELAPILRDASFISREAWCERPSEWDDRIPRTTDKYPNAIEFPDSLNAHLLAYESAARKWVEIRREISTLKRESVSRQANKLWDEA